MNDITDEHVPTELYTFFRWVLQGTKSNLSYEMSESKRAAVNKHAKSLAQSTVSYHLSDRQTRHNSDSVRYHNKMSQQLVIGVAIRQATRDKKVINLLHGFGVSVGYEHLLKLENEIAITFLQKMKENDGVYVPANIACGRHIFFAVDNVEFAEDTPNGKHTLHGTVMAMYQRRDSDDKTYKLDLTGQAEMKTIKELPSTITDLLPCRIPKNPKPPSPAYPTFALKAGKNMAMTAHVKWLGC